MPSESNYVESLSIVEPIPVRCNESQHENNPDEKILAKPMTPVPNQDSPK